ncbi:MAG: transporter associated domain-containing protein [Thiobacillaceae bacterium]
MRRCDAVGGLVISRFGHVPKRGESVNLGGLGFAVLRADSRRLHTLRVTRPGVDADGQLPLV